MTNDGVHSYTYDAENRIQSVDGGSTTYVYGPAGMRVRKTTGGVSVDYLYDLGGNAVTELNSSGAWTRKEIYAGSRHVATYKDGPTGQTYFSHPDWLGTERARTDKNGAVTETCTNLPFGDAQTCTGTSVSPLHFTGKQRDTETDNDYFGARYYVSRQGRWLTPDWSARGEAVPYASLANPQTLNLYAYVGNNPVTAADPDGHIQAMAVGRGPGNEAIAGFMGRLFSEDFLPGGGISVGLASSPALASSGTLTSSTRADANAAANALADPLQAQEPPKLSITAKIYSPLSLGGTPEVQQGVPLTTTITANQALPPGQLTIEARLYQVNEKATRGELLLFGNVAVVDSKLVGSSGGAGSKPAADSLVVRILPFEKRGNLGYSGPGFIRFTVTDSRGQKASASSPVTIKSNRNGVESSISKPQDAFPNRRTVVIP